MLNCKKNYGIHGAVAPNRLLPLILCEGRSNVRRSNGCKRFERNPFLLIFAINSQKNETFVTFAKIFIFTSASVSRQHILKMAKDAKDDEEVIAGSEDTQLMVANVPHRTHNICGVIKEMFTITAPADDSMKRDLVILELFNEKDRLQVWLWWRRYTLILLLNQNPTFRKVWHCSCGPKLRRRVLARRFLHITMCSGMRRAVCIFRL